MLNVGIYRVNDTCDAIRSALLISAKFRPLETPTYRTLRRVAQQPRPGDDRPVHIVHDVDRDGLGSAAMLCAELGPDRVRLHPTKDKDVRALLTDLEGEVIVLDIGAPPSWAGVPASLDITWVDHHLATWGSTPPPNVKPILPTTDKATTTMSLLVKHQVVTIPNVIDGYVGKLCGGEPDFAWGFVFDALTKMRIGDWPVEIAELPALLAPGPRGEPVPARLMHLVEETRRARETCRAILDASPTQVLDQAVVVETSDAKRIPLARFSLEIQRRHPGRIAVVVHRGSLLYCGRPSGRPGLDFVEHFLDRGLDPKGHPYVVTVRVRPGDMPSELQALLVAIREAAG